MQHEKAYDNIFVSSHYTNMTRYFKSEIHVAWWDPLVLFKYLQYLIVSNNKMRIESGMHMGISGAPGVLVEESRQEILYSSDWVFMICRVFMIWYAQFFPAVKRLVATKSTSLPVNDQKIRVNVPTLYQKKKPECLDSTTVRSIGLDEHSMTRRPTFSSKTGIILHVHIHTQCIHFTIQLLGGVSIF